MKNQRPWIWGLPDPKDLPGPALIYTGASPWSHLIFSELQEERGLSAALSHAPLSTGHPSLGMGLPVSVFVSPDPSHIEDKSDLIFTCDSST